MFLFMLSISLCVFSVFFVSFSLSFFSTGSSRECKASVRARYRRASERTASASHSRRRERNAHTQWTPCQASTTILVCVLYLLCPSDVQVDLRPHSTPLTLLILFCLFFSFYLSFLMRFDAISIDDSAVQQSRSLSLSLLFLCLVLFFFASRKRRGDSDSVWLLPTTTTTTTTPTTSATIAGALRAPTSSPERHVWSTYLIHHAESLDTSCRVFYTPNRVPLAAPR